MNSQRLYVDDLLIFAMRAELDKLKEAFTHEFKWITMDVGCIHSYLGMQLKFEDGQVKVDMMYNLDKVLQEFPGLKEELLPSKKDLFALSRDSVVLPEKEKRFFHTIVAKLLYLS